MLRFNVNFNRYRFYLYSIILIFNLDQDENYYNIDGEIDYLTTSIVSAEASILAKSQMGNAFINTIMILNIKVVFYAVFL